MEIIGIGILFMIGLYIAPIVIMVAIVIIGVMLGFIADLFSGNDKRDER